MVVFLFFFLKNTEAQVCQTVTVFFHSTEAHREVKLKVKECLRTEERVALTCNTWTTSRAAGFMCNSSLSQSTGDLLSHVQNACYSPIFPHARIQLTWARLQYKQFSLPVACNIYDRFY